ncbi:MAG: hypothetical protein K9H64_10095 [Bacteroidales bacterium]|nr:hypothetical protein [Bacteroidales bacterium]MCF8456218.1 hypothetical protein [Bacteroidales bacterium]
MPEQVNHQILKQGDTYPFMIFNLIEISGIEYFVLIDPHEKKHLLASSYYSHYGFEIGQEIMCTIDKINCTGKIYLEPTNPFYSVGDTYEFIITEEKTRINSLGEKERHLVVADLFGKPHQLWIPKNGTDYRTNESLELCVVQIRKGNLFLVLPSLCLHGAKYEVGKAYQFTIDGISTLIEDKEYYQLKDKFGQVHFLRAKFYTNYSFSPGKTFTGRIVQKPQTGSYYIEPDYPGYEIGKSYDFTFVKEDVYFHPSGQQEDIWVVHDQSGKNCYLFLTHPISEDFKNKPIRAFVDNVYKGKLYLQPSGVGE